MTGQPDIVAFPTSSLVPGRSYYSFQYFGDGRMFSYAHQLQAVFSFSPRKVLEVGVGAGIVAAALRAAGISVTTLDIQADLHPDLVGSVTNIPIENGVFDVSLCCQVLEHLPFDQFIPALQQLRRVSMKGLVISLPDISRYCYVAFRLPRLRPFRFCWTVPYLRSRRMPPERLSRCGHYWEIGFAEYPLARILDAIEHAGCQVTRNWRVPELPWHHFFQLKPVAE